MHSTKYRTAAETRETHAWTHAKSRYAETHAQDVCRDARRDVYAETYMQRETICRDACNSSNGCSNNRRPVSPSHVQPWASLEKGALLVTSHPPFASLPIRDPIRACVSDPCSFIATPPHVTHTAVLPSQCCRCSVAVAVLPSQCCGRSVAVFNPGCGPAESDLFAYLDTRERRCGSRTSRTTLRGVGGRCSHTRRPAWRATSPNE